MGDSDATVPARPTDQPTDDSSAVTAAMRTPTIPGYGIDGVIGTGGMARVYSGHHQVLDRRVAIKVIKEAWSSDPDYRARFLREARLVAQLDHPGVVRVHDAGETGQDVFLVMDYIAGGDLGQRLDREGRLPVAEARRLIRACLEALAAVHAAGIIHRDLKPDNILLDTDGRPLLSDLGLARPSEDSDRLTATGAAMGTPSYMSPEQAKGSPDIDHRTDLYSLAATWYALLAGRPPFDGSTPWATVAALINETPPRVSDLVPTVPRAEADLIARCLAKRPEQRPADAASLLQAIDRLPDPTLATTTAAWPERLRQSWWAPRLAIVIAVFLIFLFWSPFGGEAAVPSPPAATTTNANTASQPQTDGVAIVVTEAAPERTVRPAETADADGHSAVAAEADSDEADSDEADSDDEKMSAGVHGFLGGLRQAFRKPTIFSVDASLEHASVAVKTALTRLEASTIADEDDDHDTVYLAQLPDREVRVRLRPAEDGGTEIEIQSGAIHDKEVGAEVQQAIEAALE